MSAKDDDWEFQPLGFVMVINRTPSLPSSRIGASAAVPSSAWSPHKLVNEATEPDSAIGLVSSGEVLPREAHSRALARPRARARTAREPACFRATWKLSWRRGPGRPELVERLRERLNASYNGAQRLVERLWEAGGVKMTEALSAFEQLLVAKREQRSRNVANTSSPLSGDSMAARAARSVSISPRLWNDLPPTRRCGMPRASSAST